MYVCVCNAITSSQIVDNPNLIYNCGTRCGKCIQYIKQSVYTGTETPLDTEVIRIYKEKSVLRTSTESSDYESNNTDSQQPSYCNSKPTVAD